MHPGSPVSREGRRVCIVICTYQRPELLDRLLGALEGLVFGLQPAPDLEIIVVDNSPEYESRPVVASRSKTAPGRLRLLEVGAGNISVARNHGLDAVPSGTEVVAWLDDDEMPVASWLDEMLTVREQTGAEIVIGPVLGRLPHGAPDWAHDSRLYDALEDLPDLEVLEEGITGNALLEVAMLRRLELRFDEQLGHAGGEDQLFFRTARASGVTMRFAARATVWEEVPPARLSRTYLSRREYRKGNTLGLLDRGQGGLGGRPVRRLAAAGWWLATGGFGMVSCGLNHDTSGSVLARMRISRALGMVAGLLLMRFDHYEKTPTHKRPAILVVREDPSFQEAGHTRYLRAFCSHLQAQERPVTLILVGTRLRRFLRRRASTHLVTPRMVSALGWDLTYDPQLVASSISWWLLNRLPAPLTRSAMSARRTLRRRRGVDHVLGHTPDPATDEWLLAHLAEQGRCIVLFDSVFTLPSVPLPGSASPHFVITHDIVSERADALRSRGYQVLPEGFEPSTEAGLLRRAGTAIAINERDAEALRRLTSGASVDVVVVPVVIEPVGALPSNQTAGRCLFVGSGSLHNVDGLSWFLDSVWPVVVAAEPGAELHVVGSVCNQLSTKAVGIVLRGEVDDLLEEYGEAEIVIVPLLAGSGLKVKTVEALVRGRAVVSTSAGVQGLMSVDPAPFVVADSAALFAQALLNLFSAPARRLRLEAAAATAAPLFGSAQAFAKFDAVLPD